MSKSALEDMFAAALAATDLPPATQQYPFVPGRRFRADFAWPEQKILVEINGGQWGRSGHSSGLGLQRDAEKGNLAAVLGYRILTFTTTMIKTDLAGCIRILCQVLQDN